MGQQDVVLPTDADIERERIRALDAQAEAASDDWGCDYCRNDGKLTSSNTCPKCDAQFEI
jgi:hypothetical protein